MPAPFGHAVTIMTLGAIHRVLCCALLLAGMCAAQTLSANANQFTCEVCLPEAPSAVQQANFNAMLAVPAVMPTRALSPAERPFQPMTAKEKFNQFLHRSYSPYTIFNGLYDATLAQAAGDQYQYGGGMEGWGKRLGSAVAGAETRSFFGTFLFPTLLRQDARYMPMYHGSVWKRMWHAASRVAITRGDNGEQQVNVSGLMAVAASESIDNLWLPPNQRGLDASLNRGLGALQGQATTYLLREFTPDLVRFFKNHAPKRLVRIEEKIPQRLLSSTPEGEE